MAIFNPNTIDFTKDEVKEIGSAMIERTFNNPSLSDVFTITEGVKKAQQIAFLGRLTTKLGKGSGGCDPTASTAAIPATQKVWNPVTISDRLAFCWKTDVKGTFFQWATKNGIAKEDLTGTDFANFITERVADGMEEMLHRLAWFNDTDAALTTDSPAGVISPSETIDFFNKLDGAWKQLFAIAAADSDRLSVNSTLQTRNNASTYADQKFTAADVTNLVVSKTFDQMEKDMDERLSGSGDLVVRVTKSVWDQYRSELKFANIAYTTERLESGIEVLYADGREVQKYSVWDRIIKESFDDGSKYYLPHRILMYDKNNIGLATEQEGNFSEIDLFYDKKDKKVYLDFQFDLDVKVLENYLVQMAY